jgi:hypothetical protein
MKKAWIALAAVALLALPAAAGARNNKHVDVRNAAKYCKSLHTQMGADAFRQAYGGGSNAFGKCVKQRAKKLKTARKAAVRACKQQFKGSSHQLRRHGKPDGAAFRKCVRDKTKADTSNDDQGTLDAANQCAAERDSDPAAFEEEYSTDDPGRTAFEECVSEHADDNDQTDDPGDGTDPGAPGDSQGGDAQPGGGDTTTT